MARKKQQPQESREDLGKRLTSFRRRRRFIPYRESFEYSRKLDRWLDDIEEGLLTALPEKATELLEKFLRSDDRIFQQLDDSGGNVGDVFRRACSLWARAMAELPPSPDRVDQVYDLHTDNGYGVRDGVLEEAAVLLGEAELRQLARRYEREAEEAPADRGALQFSMEGLIASSAMGQVAQALGDAKLYERSIRVRCPELNHLQLESIARVYLEFGPPERAVELLEGTRDLSLWVEALEAAGDEARLADARKRLFAETLNPEDLAAYVALLPEGEREAGAQWGMDEALHGKNLSSAVHFLLSLGEKEAAERLLLRRVKELEQYFYNTLLYLAEAANEAGSALIEAACFRALTLDILGGGRTRAYGHAKRYCMRLQRLEDLIGEDSGLGRHEDFMAGLRDTHGLKSSFWRRFKGG